jgi:hypothetical protein
VMGNFLARACRFMRAESLLEAWFWFLARLGVPRATVGCDLAPRRGRYHWLRRAEQSLGVVAGFIHHQGA